MSNGQWHSDMGEGERALREWKKEQEGLRVEVTKLREENARLGLSVQNAENKVLRARVALLEAEVAQYRAGQQTLAGMTGGVAWR